MRLLISFVAVIQLLIMSSTALADEDPHHAYTRVQFDALASTVVDNDSLRATLFVEVEDSTASAATSKATRATNNALRLLRRDAELRVRTGAYRTFSVSDRGKITGWRARSELIVESEKPARVSAAIGAVSDFMQLSSVAFFVSPRLREEVEADLVDQAIKAFLEKAQRIAKSFGKAQFEVAEANVASQGSGPPPQPMMRAMAADAATMTPEFSTGTTRLSVTVSGAILIPR